MVGLSLEKATFYVGKLLGMAPAELASSFRPAAEHELPQILLLRRQFLPPQESSQDECYLRWRYQFEGPDNNCLWVCKKQERLLGMVGVEHVRIYINGTLHPAVRLMDILVPPEINGSGLGAWMNLALLEKYPFVYAIGDNENSANLLKKIFHAMPAGCNYIYHITSGQVAAKLIPRSIRLARLLDPAVGMLLSIRNFMLKPPRQQGLTFSPISHFDSEFDRLCEAASSRGITFARRGADSLNWRFVSNPNAYATLGCFLGSELIAYCVYRVDRKEPEGSIKGRIVDWLIKPPCAPGSSVNPYGAEEEKALIHLLSRLFFQAVLAMKQQHVDLVAAVVHDEVSKKALRRIGFVLRPGATGFYVKTSNPQLHTALVQPDRWFITGFDDDTV